MLKKLLVCGVFAAQGLFPARVAGFNETFDSGGLDERLWSGDYTITTALKEIKEKDRALFDNDTPFVKLDAGLDASGSLAITALSAPEDSVLRFRFRTEIAANARQSFTVLVDGEKAASFEGVDVGWRTARLPLKAGAHSVTFLTAAGRMQVSGGYNAVYLDDVALVPDRAAALLVFPAGNLDTYINARGAYRICLRAASRRPDGSEKEDARPVLWQASGGAAVDADGFFSAEKEGVYTVSARRGELASDALTITVHGADYIRRPYTYPGTGKTYAGFNGKPAKNAPPIPAAESLRVTYPPVSVFEADAFFTLEGTVNKPRARNYARVEVLKEDAPQNADGGAKTARASGAPAKRATWYIVKDTFSTRVWLPFGKGRYRVSIQVFDTVSVTSPPSGEGMLRGGAYSEEPLILTVTNTREEPGVDGDGRWIYPSFNVQADDFIVSNLAQSLTGHLTNEREKIAAIHDHIVASLVYDRQSFSNPARSRKMDAVSVIAAKTGVCEGYTYLSAALLRGAGIPACVITSRAINHAWNHVYTGGAWLFYDATWDDPVPDRGPEVIGRTYFLLESLSGGDRRHGGEGSIVHGDVE